MHVIVQVCWHDLSCVGGVVVKGVCALSPVGSFITVYFPMPVAISSRISVNCHPGSGRLHVGHLTGAGQDLLAVTMK